MTSPSVSHAFVSSKPDGSDATQIQPSHWNDGHTITGLGTAAEADAGDFQPIDADLTAIAALSTTAYGRSLLELADQAALQSEAGGGGGGASVSVVSSVITLTPSNTSGSVSLPAGARLIDVLGSPVGPSWNDTSPMDLGDGDDADGFLVALDLSSADVSFGDWALFSESYLNSDTVTVFSNSFGAYWDAGINRFYRRYYPSGGTITATVNPNTATAGELSLTVIYAVPATSAPTGLQSATVTLSSAQLLDLHNTPVTLVAAPGADEVIAVSSWEAWFRWGASFYSLLSDPTIAYASGPTIGILSYNLGGGQDSTEFRRPGEVVFADPSSSATGKAVVATVGDAITDGDSTLVVVVHYTIEDVP